MPFGNAWRRIGASTEAAAAHDHEIRAPAARVAMRALAAALGFIQGALIVGAIVLANAAIIKVIDAALDRLHD